MKDLDELTRNINEYAKDKVGFDLVGIAKASDPQFDRAPKGHHPEEWLPGAKSVVVGGIKVIREILDTTPSPLYAKHYDQLNVWLLEAGYRLVRGIQDLGFKALYFPETDPYMYFDEKRNHGEPRMSPSFCHLHAAVASGLGKRGKVGVVLTPDYGPRQRWLTVITTAELIPNSRMEREMCLEFIKPGSCGDRCIKVCHDEQSGALKAWPEEGGVIQYKCTFSDLKARGLACGRCIAVCPVGKD
jgi:O-acetylhomoserine (thiol)-lyase